MIVTSRTRTAPRPRAFVRVAGPDAEGYLQRMLSNDVAALGVGEAMDALLLTPKSRLIAPLRVLRRATDDFLLLTEPELGERVRAELVRFRLAAKAEIEAEEHRSILVFATEAAGIPTRDYGEPAVEVLDQELPGDPMSADELERLRIEAGTPAWGAELDERVLPAEAGLDETHVSFTKGCYPGQEPIARLRHRGHVNRVLQSLEFEGEPPRPGSELTYGGARVGRVTSVAAGIGLGYVRVGLPDRAELEFAAPLAGRARLRARAR